MKLLSCSATVIVVAAVSTSAFAQDRGEAIFNQTCVACHTIGSGRLVGPDLAGVHTRREEAWLISIIQSAQSLIDDGDPVAEELLSVSNGVVMPNQTMPVDDIRAVLGYIALRSGGVVASDRPAEDSLEAELLPENVRLGQDLFTGRTRFSNGGTSCISCHSLNTGDVMTGGSLAKDLTDSVPRLTRSGVDAMIANPPFAPMRVAFEGRMLTEDERTAVVDYLQFVDASQDGTEHRDYRAMILTYGLLGIGILLGFFFLIGLRGTKRTVNRAIYERQISSI